MLRDLFSYYFTLFKHFEQWNLCLIIKKSTWQRYNNANCMYWEFTEIMLENNKNEIFSGTLLEHGYLAQYSIKTLRIDTSGPPPY